MARHLNIPVSQNKEDLVTSIFEKVKQKKLIIDLEEEEMKTEYETSFRRNVNTFPR